MPSYPKPPKREPTKRKRVNPVSASRKEENALRAELRPHWFRREGVCVALTTGYFTGDRCLGDLTIHEPWTRGRGGPVDDPRNWFTLCAEHNRLVSQDADWQDWAEAVGLLFHEREGREWLDAGGRFPGLTKEQAVEQVRSW